MEQKNEKQYPIDIITAMAERTITRLWITIIILIAALALSIAGNIFAFWYESQFVDEEVTQDIDTGEGNAYVAGIGDVNYGEGEADGEEENP